MGTPLNHIRSNFYIAAHHKEGAFLAIKALTDRTDLMRNITWLRNGHETGRHFSWVDMDDLRCARTLAGQLAEFRWEASLEPDGSIGNLKFTGEKVGDCDYLFRAIAPFVWGGSTITMDLWTWTFQDMQVTKTWAKDAR